MSNENPVFGSAPATEQAHGVPYEHQSISPADLYHRLGKLEGLMQGMMGSVDSFGQAIKDIHARIDRVEQRQGILEKSQSQEAGSDSVLRSISKDYVIPIAAIVITWFAAKSGTVPSEHHPNKRSQYILESRPTAIITTRSTIS
jgi:hypothetical protein